MQDIVNIQTAECTGRKRLLYFNKMHGMIWGDQKEHRHVSQTEHGRNLGGSVEQIIGKNNEDNSNNNNNKNDGAGLMDMHRIWAELFQKLQKHQEAPGRHGKGTGKHGEAPGSTGKH